jgi:uncharacterized protein YkwD
MYKFGFRISTAAAIAAASAGLMVSGVAAATPTNATSAVHAATFRVAPATLPRRVTASPVNSRRVEQFGRLAPAPAVLVPRVAQTTGRIRSLPGPLPVLSTAPDAFHISQQQILINQDRAGSGLPALAWSPCLATVALQNAQRIAAQGYLSHTNGPTVDLGCDPTYTWAGENIGDTSAGIDDAQLNTLFMNSAPHKANILNSSYRFVGTAWVVASNGYGYIAVEFAG